MSGHPSCRHLSKEEVVDIEKMSMAGIPPRHILSSLRQKNPDLHAVSRTIYNLKAKIQKDSLSGRSLIQAVFEELEQEGFILDYLKDGNGHLTHIFFAHPKSIVLARTYSSVFVMDCTYKTNKYGMPLLDIIGMSSFNKSFYSAFAFLKSERTEDYVWALQKFSNVLGLNSQPLVIVSDRELALMSAIKVVFLNTTNLLCVWHIQKNIVAKCKGYFQENEDWDVSLSMWNTVVYAETEEEYEEKKEKFVSVWTEKYMHFGNRASSRAEGAHAKLKKYLQVSTGNLRQVKGKICLAIENEFQEIKTQLESERLRIPHRYNVSYFKNLINRVSVFALKMLFNQYEMAKYGTLKPYCTGNFMATMGLPCAHKMCDWKEGTLSLDHVHSQWMIDTKSLGSSCGGNESYDDGNEMKELLDKLHGMYLCWPTFQKLEVKKKISQILHMEDPLVHEPNVQTRKKRKAKSKKGKGSTSTSRDPSEFEIVEAAWNNKTSQSVGEASMIGIDLNMPFPPT